MIVTTTQTKTAGAGTGARATINGTPIVLQPKETVLQAALREGIDFPYSCRVGGCATCKCKLVSGQVRELTETGYILSADELEQGYILACQSVPRGDVEIEVDLERGAVSGQIVGQRKVTHDITRLDVQLERPLDYRAGQFVTLSLEALPGVSRPYSFATPANAQGQVSFYIREVPGGQLSGLVASRDLVGERVRLSDVAGELWLREGEAPVVMVAGGSGLPPLLAILRAAADAGQKRDVVLLFGARQQRDLYALDEIEALRKVWRGEFVFVPVLSEEPEGSGWQGARGLVTEQLGAHVQPHAQAYLCGPPGMIDAAVERLEALGVAREAIWMDRFVTQADAALPPVSQERDSALAGVLHYMKFFMFHVIGLLSVLMLVAGHKYTTIGLLAVVTFYLIGDAISGDDTSTPRLRHAWLLTAQLWLALPLLVLIVFVSLWTMCSGDPLGFGAMVQAWTGYDALAARAITGTGHHISGLIITGLMIGMVGTIPAHELTHRTWDKVSMLIGRWLLAFSFDTSFAIEHVYGHHRYVSTTHDPATAPRGRNVYYHVLASTLKGNMSAWQIEAARLARRHLPVWSLQNKFLRGHAMSLVLVALAWLMGGWKVMLYFIACGLFAKALLEIVNYMEHYGMVRDPATPVQPRHSWNTNRRISSWTMFNLTRHSHHHAQGEVPYQDLRPYPDAPMMVGGYLTTIVVALIPPLWHRLMTPKVLEWDARYATPKERILAREANAKSGIAALSRAV
jgi:NAD(P)H-flavin reductase/ferredoxin